MNDVLLVLNAGSSSVKFSVFLDSDPPRELLRGQLEGIMTAPRFRARDAEGHIVGEREWPSGTVLGHVGAIEFLVGWSRDGALGAHRIAAVGHRVVHGGTKFSTPVVVTPQRMESLRALVPLAPLHQPHNLAAIDAITKHAPHLPQVACFDTAFHATQPPVAQLFALPRCYFDKGVRRYGFHGLSYEYIASVLPSLDERAATGRTVIAHRLAPLPRCATITRPVAISGAAVGRTDAMYS